MKPKPVFFCAFWVLFAAIALSGCLNGSATEAHLKFGVPGVFLVQHDSVADRATDKAIRLGDSKTHVQILLFDYEGSGKDIVISKPKPDQKINPTPSKPEH